ncbi:MAG: cobalt-precorrin-5B (C(1))-methyltransferase CbiD [Alistipes sp.]|jgi:cobalt-precorrin-5B (C1)-methyltransferase|nr:cobalt-precorrin-5B (C(1))-methyltransferase CbiD [Alistipes sp.]
MTRDGARILIFGGTTEGRAAVKVVAEGGARYFYSTLTAAQQVEIQGGVRLTGALTASDAEELCRREGVRLIVDATHPFARGVHETAAAAGAACAIPVVRYERRGVGELPDVTWCDDYDDAVARLEAAGVRRLLALTGVRTIPRLREFWDCGDGGRECRFRVLDRPESIAEALSCGFPREGLLFYREGEPEIEVLRREAPDAILTKESGASGGLHDKVAAARELGIPLYVVRRPALPEGLARHTVYTEAGLRRRIEELLPGWFELRSGYTTGTCATAAACAALRGLMFGEVLREVEVVLPGGERVRLPVLRMSVSAAGFSAEATVVKDAGDDPDVTNGCEITACVSLSRNGAEGIRFLQGEGVGCVTLLGLGIEVGEPAINPAPREMIRENFAMLGTTRAEVTISVKDGAELAQKTLNQRFGITGGISIIGTSGIVRPFSNEAFVESVERAVDVARAVGCPTLVISSGARSEAAVRSKFPDLPPQAFVHYGNFVGETLRAASRAGFAEVALGIMIGKAVKLAEGHLDTHSRGVTMNREFLAQLALGAGCSRGAAELIGRMTLARELWTGLSAPDRALFMPALVAACHKHCSPLLPEGRLTMMMIPEVSD